MKYKGTYRLKPNLDQFTNDFPRTDDEGIDPSYDDIYIKCANGSQIYHYGKSTLVAYIPSIGRGHNILIAIAKELNLISESTGSRDYETLYSLLEKDGTVFNIREYDSEIEFKFNAKNIEMIAKYLKPQTFGADISPFSTRNLPKSNYKIPHKDLNEYKTISKNLTQMEKMQLGRAFVKKYKLSKEDMKKVCMKNNQYIHYCNLWTDYINFIQKENEKNKNS